MGGGEADGGGGLYPGGDDAATDVASGELTELRSSDGTLDLVCEIVDREVAVIRVELGGFTDGLVEGGIDAGAEVYGGGFRLNAGEKFVEEDADGEDVRALIDGVILGEDFGCGVSGGAVVQSFGEGAIHFAGEAEVGDFRL